MITFYNKIINDFNNLSINELLSVNYSLTFNNYLDIIQNIESFYDKIKNDVLENRKFQENSFHNFLLHQIIYRLQEIKAYSEVNIFDTRRLVSVSSDCISTIQVLIREKIHLNVYFRSSDFDDALPIDLLFLSNIPKELIEHFDNFKHITNYKELNIENINILKQKQIVLNLMFGSLHRGINVL